MSNERIDEFLSWRGQLDGPRGVPGQGLDDHEAAWERLMDKIAGTRRRRFFGYRAAAACVLLALIPAVGFFYDRHSRVAAVRPVERQRIVAPGAVVHSPGAGSGAGAGDVAAIRTERAQPEAPGRAKQVPEATGRVNEVPEAAGRVNEVPEAAGRVNPGPGAQERQGHQGARYREPARQEPVQIAGLARQPAVVTPAAIIAMIADSATALKFNMLKNKPLRIVHINELPGGPGPQPAVVTASDAARHFEFFLTPGQSLRVLPPPPPATDAALLKVRLSPSN
jgi:hypothetical protein